MIFNSYLLAFRDYKNFIVAYSNANHNHFILKDIYSEFFRAYFSSEMKKDEIIQLISSNYEVDENTVSSDLESFFQELIKCCSVSTYEDSNEASRNLSDSDIYAMMTDMLIPFSATIEITDRCNLDCIHCYRDDSKTAFWNIYRFEKVLSELKELGTLHLTLTGGEPLLHPNFNEFLELSNRYGFVVAIQTNATVDLSLVIDQLINMPIKNIAISLYSMPNGNHDQITRKEGSCQATINNICKSAEKNIPLIINCPVMTLNRGDMQSVKEFSDSLGAFCNFSFKIIPSQSPYRNTEQLNCFSTEFLYQCIKNPKIKLYKDILSRIRSATPRIRYCQTGFRSITLDAEGEILLCNAYRKKCGNIEQKRIKEIWYTSKELVNWRNKISLINKKCMECKAFAYCEPCPAHEYTLTGNENAVDSLTCLFGKTFYDADNRFCLERKEV